MKLDERIKQAFQASRKRRMRYHDLARAVFPVSEFPKAWRYASHGGPPGCFMALSAAIRRMGFASAYENGCRYIYRG